MEKQKKWQLYLIIAVILLTVYNILPTVFYYAKPLKSPIDQTRAQSISKQILERINQLEPEAEEWLTSFCKLIQVKPLTISINSQQPQFAALSFKDEEDASKFRQFLPRAGALMPFVPAQLSLYNTQDEASKNVVVQRRIPIHFDSNQTSNYAQFSQKFDAQRKPTTLYRALVEDRALQVGIAFGGTSENAAMLQALTSAQQGGGSQQLLLQLSQNIDTFVKVYGEKSAITQRYFASFTQIADVNRAQLVQGFLNQLDSTRSTIGSQRKALKDQSDTLRAQGQFLETVKQQELDLLSAREKTLEQAYAIVKRNAQSFGAGKTPFTYGTLSASLQNKPAEGVQVISLMGCNPFVEQIAIDWSNEKILLSLYSDVEKVREQLDMSNSKTYLRDMADQLLYNEIAFASRQSGETISPFQDKFEIALSQLQNSDSFIALRLSTIAAEQSKQLVETLQSTWQPKHTDLSRDAFPIYDYETYLQLPESKQNLCL
ncbi:MAG: protein translocase subunit SecDF, partial [Chlamydiota bacterium]